MAPERLGRDTPHETVAPLQRSEMVMISPTQKHRQHLCLHGDGTHAPTDPSPTTAVDGVVFCPWAGYRVWGRGRARPWQRGARNAQLVQVSGAGRGQDVMASRVPPADGTPRLHPREHPPHGGLRPEGASLGEEGIRYAPPSPGGILAQEPAYEP